MSISQRINAATFSIPNRWQKGAFQIKSYIEDYSRKCGQPFTANIAGESDSGSISIDSFENLTANQRLIADNAVFNLNSFLNRPTGEPWKARSQADSDLDRQLSEIEKVFSDRS